MKNLDALRGTGKTKPGLEVVSSGQFLKAGIPAETYSCFWSVVDTAAVDSCISTGVGTGFPVMTDEVCSDIADLDDDGGDCARSATQKYLKDVDKRCEQNMQVDKNVTQYCEKKSSVQEAANLKDFEVMSPFQASLLRYFAKKELEKQQGAARRPPRRQHRDAPPPPGLGM